MMNQHFRRRPSTVGLPTLGLKNYESVLRRRWFHKPLMLQAAAGRGPLFGIEGQESVQEIQTWKESNAIWAQDDREDWALVRCDAQTLEIHICRTMSYC